MRKSRSAESISFAEERRRLFEEKLAYKANNIESKNRMKLQELIQTRVEEGVDKETIIAELAANPNYAKFEQYFEGWVENKIQKNEIQKQKQAKQEEER